MKKMFRFLRSMQFGMILLLLVIACSVAGSLIVQQREPMEYVSRYGADWAKIILALGLDDVFSTPWFFALMGALCLNLVLCSVMRLPRIIKAPALLAQQGKNLPIDTFLTPGQAEKLETYLKKNRYRCLDGEDRKIFLKGRAGFYGSFLTHLSFLLILVVGAGAVMTAQVKDITVMPGQTITLEDGTAITVERFQIEDESGKLDYASLLTALSPDGSAQSQKEIRVNEPMRFGQFKIYQQTYGTAGSVKVDNLQNGASEIMSLTESCFLTLDGKNGMFFQALYPGYIKEEDGTVTLVTSTSGDYSDPVYDVLSVADGATTPVLAFPGETLTIGDVSFTLLDPVSYPGLRIKQMNSLVMAALYAVFVLMVAALYLCFFVTPVAVVLTKEGYGLTGPKTHTQLLLQIEQCIQEGEK